MSDIEKTEIENLIPSYQVGDGNSVAFELLMGRLDDEGRAIVADYLMGRPYRPALAIQS